MIFPFFLFIVGVSIPLALGPRLEGDGEGLIGRVVRRSAVIFALGLLLHALPFFHLSTLRVPGVLQRIALCYLLAALLFVLTGGGKGWRAHAAVAGVLLVGYWLLMTRVAAPGHAPGDLSPTGNLAGYVDRLVLGPEHMWKVSPWYDPEGILSTLPAVATTLLGVLAGHWLRHARPTGRLLSGLVVAGAAAAALGWLWGLAFPVNKSLWTSSYALMMSGFAALGLALCYWVFEVHGARRWARPFVLFGLTALPLFFLSTAMARLLLLIRVGPEQTRLHAWLFTHLFAPWAEPANASLAFALAYVLLWWVLMWGLQRTGIRLRV
jgi:predicted acyltransferase